MTRQANRTTLWAHNYATVEGGGLRLRIERDTNAPNPREEGDNLGTMVLFYPSQCYGDPHDYDNAEEFFRDLAGQSGVPIGKIGVTQTDREAIGEKFLILPLFISVMGRNERMATFGFTGCPDNTFPAGFIYADRADLADELGTDDAEKMRQALDVEVQRMDRYLAGDIWGFITELAEECGACKHTHWRQVDAIWGYYGSDLEDSGLYDALPKPYRKLLLEHDC